jgi:hypothetical protein
MPREQSFIQPEPGSCSLTSLETAYFLFIEPGYDRLLRRDTQYA